MLATVAESLFRSVPQQRLRQLGRGAMQQSDHWWDDGDGDDAGGDEDDAFDTRFLELNKTTMQQ